MLLIEDDPVTGSALTTILKRRGFIVTRAATVAEGLKQLQNHPQFVILDLMLPDGDGTVILQHIRRQQLDIRVLVTTAVSEPESLRAVRDLRPDLILHKPIDLGRLLAGLTLRN